MEKETLIQEIRTAFKGVKLEDGIGLREGMGMDDYAPPSRLQELRQKDEREDWTAIPFREICGWYEDAFCYMDAKGLRFHLPQYIIADLLEEELAAQGIHMSYDPFWVVERFTEEDIAFYSQPQILAIVHYLEYLIELQVQEDREYGCIDDPTRYRESCILARWRALLASNGE
ncbi:MAG: hypothetical protein CSA97_02940 [Bacteroidetes bacterium]|nr:MAG: hypothetical protein CSA97_02940 [Bacteroidota bacterium]